MPSLVAPSRMPGDNPRASDQPPRPAGFVRIASAVLWSFFGVRKRRSFEEDVATIEPQYIIVAGVIGGVLFVLILISVVRVIIAYA